MLAQVQDAVADAMMTSGPDGHTDGYKVIAQAAIDAIPDGWAKVGGEWVRVGSREDCADPWVCCAHPLTAEERKNA